MEQILLPVVALLFAVGLIAIYRVRGTEGAWQQLLRGFVPGMVVILVFIWRPGIVETMRRWTLPLLALPLVLPLSAAVARAQAPEIPPGYTVYQVLGPGIDAPPLPFKIEGDRLVAPEGGMVTVTGGRVTEDRIDVTMDVPGATVRFLGTRDGDAFTGYSFLV